MHFLEYLKHSSAVVDWLNDTTVLFFCTNENGHMPIAVAELFQKPSDDTTIMCRIIPYVPEIDAGLFECGSNRSLDRATKTYAPICFSPHGHSGSSIEFMLYRKRVELNPFHAESRKIYDEYHGSTKFTNKKWLINNGYAKDDDNIATATQIQQLSDELNEIRATLNTMTELLERLTYAPGGPAYQEAKTDFDTLASS